MKKALTNKELDNIYAFADELIKMLQETDPARVVVISRDAEGNGYSPARTCYEMNFCADEAEVYEEIDAYQGGQPAFVLWP